MILTVIDRLTIANYIKQEIENNFDDYYVSRNLVDTMFIHDTLNKDGTHVIAVEIPAEMYNVKLWETKRAIVYTGEGSYASEVDTVGGYSKYHKNYVDKAIQSAISRWLKENGMEAKIEDE